MKSHVIKDSQSFAVFHASEWCHIHSDIEDPHTASAGYGFYHHDMRFINFFKIDICNASGEPLTYNIEFIKNSHIGCLEWIISSPDKTWEILHQTFVQNNGWHHGFKFIKNDSNIDLKVNIYTKVNVEDIFEIRHFVEPISRKIEFAEKSNNKCEWSYSGLDTKIRKLIALTSGSISPPDNKQTTLITIPLSSKYPIGRASFIARYHDNKHENLEESFDEIDLDESISALKDSFKTFKNQFAIPKNINKEFEPWIEKAITDLFLLQGEVNGNPCIQAGIPWFATLFGRDSLIAAEQSLNFAPFLSKYTLKALADVQTDRYDDRFDEQPGKIIHELRHSERGNLGHVPFGKYYGTVDATPLFISLLRKYVDRTNDIKFLEEIFSNFERALNWIETELSNKEFLTYCQNAAEGPAGLKEKGWKDGDRIMIHSDGQPAPHPIAVCEVQGYAYRALCDAIHIYKLYDKNIDSKIINRLEDRAQKLKSDFNKKFWSERLNFYVIALDKNGAQTEVITSNPGHLFRCEIIDSPEKISAISKILSDPKHLFSGWGIRTFDASDSNFQPESYQLGGVWPHDTCEAIRGLFHVGETDAATSILNGLKDLAIQSNYRLPELITGHPRVSDTPQIYADSCSPQAWSATIPFALLDLFNKSEI